MLQISLDIETLGLRPGYTILSIGAVAFDHSTIGYVHPNPFYSVISRADSARRGFLVDPNTRKWWSEQSPAAQEVLDHAAEADPETHGVEPVLRLLSAWLLNVEAKSLAADPAPVWTNGPALDSVMLVAAAERVGRPLLWSHRTDSDFRTLCRMFNPEIVQAARHQAADKMAQDGGVAHNALSDAIFQARVIAELQAELRALRPLSQTAEKLFNDF